MLRLHLVFETSLKPSPGPDSSSSVSPAIIPFFYTALLLLPVILVLVRFYIRSRVKRHSFGFFHPFTNDGGGGERVLWCAVRAIQELDPSAQCFVYTGDVASPDSLAERAHNLFGVVLPRPVEVLRKSYRCLIKASRYPRFTLLGQSLQHSLSHNPCASPPLSPFQTLVVRLCYRHLVEASLYPRFTLLGQSLQHSLSHDPRASPPLSHLLTQPPPVAPQLLVGPPPVAPQLLVGPPPVAPQLLVGPPPVAPHLLVGLPPVAPQLLVGPPPVAPHLHFYPHSPLLTAEQVQQRSRAAVQQHCGAAE
ncbi:unnamed protein product [Closterium sp. NIES-65]|nr:unnamed protein product [Closterium sp. NIES-65]